MNESQEVLNLKFEIAGLKRSSERQSAMLAQALKEKNDLLQNRTGYECSYREIRAA